MQLRAIGCFAIFLSLLFAPMVALSHGQAFQGPVILTISGAIDAPTRGGHDEDDKFFQYQDLEFDAAAQFDFAALANIGMVSVRADFPKGGEIQVYQGPPLVDVLRNVGARGETITVLALDGYAIDVSIQELMDKGAVLALMRNGVPFAIGDYGPIQIVFPRASRDDLADMEDDYWVWSVFHMKIE